MPKQIKTEYGSNAANPSRPLFVLGMIGFASPFLTFILAVSSIPYGYKMAGLVVVAVAYLSICVWLYKNLPAADAEHLMADQPGGSDEANGETEGKLLALGYDKDLNVKLRGVDDIHAHAIFQILNVIQVNA